MVPLQKPTLLFSTLLGVTCLPHTPCRRHGSSGALRRFSLTVPRQALRRALGRLPDVSRRLSQLLTVFNAGFLCRRSCIPLSSRFCCLFVKLNCLLDVLWGTQSFGVHAGQIHLCSRCSLVSGSRQESECLLVIDLNVDPIQVAGP